MLRQMLDGLGLAETTPGPLILVTEFVGFVAAHRAHPESAVAFGLMGAAVALWATFVPCFLWIFAGAPHLARLREWPRLQGALDSITSAVLGVMLSLALWFALHVLFKQVVVLRAGPAHLLVPRLASADPRSFALAAASALLLMRLRWSVHSVLALAATLSLLILRLHRVRSQQGFRASSRVIQRCGQRDPSRPKRPSSPPSYERRRGHPAQR